MRAARASRTAEQMALSRAIESRKLAGERVCFDPFAERFLGAGYRALLVASPLRSGVERLIERLFAGHHGYVVARTRYIDDFLEEQLSHRPAQLVILGAGFDSRPYRFAGSLRDCAVFEVDHPATLAAKQAQLQRALGAPPAGVTYVPVDFNAQSLAEELGRAGYRAGRKTVFLWEGVTPYLTEAAVNDILGFVRGSGAGNAILFDYVIRSFIDGTCAMPGARNELDRMSRTAEPLIFGIAEGGIGAFLAERGFTDVMDVGADELKQRYFRGRNAGRYIKPWWRIVHAQVA